MRVYRTLEERIERGQLIQEMLDESIPWATIIDRFLCCKSTIEKDRVVYNKQKNK